MYLSSMNRAIRCPNGILVSILFFSSIRCFWFVDKSKLNVRGSPEGARLLENVAVRNGTSQMTRNLGEQVSRLCSRAAHFPWLLPTLNLSRSCRELATPWTRVEILYASSRDRICLLTEDHEGKNKRSKARTKNAELRRSVEHCATAIFGPAVAGKFSF
jgi:hypothetical protein